MALRNADVVELRGSMPPCRSCRCRCALDRNASDIIATGTPTGAGARFDPPRYLRAGDVVEVEVQGVGTLRNPVADEITGEGSPAARRQSPFRGIPPCRSAAFALLSLGFPNPAFEPVVAQSYVCRVAGPPGHAADSTYI
jgi:hypothetical protein